MTTVIIAPGGGSHVIALDRGTVARIDANRPAVIPIGRSAPVNVVDRRQTVITGTSMGVQGTPGETEGATFLAGAGVIIHGTRAVRIENGLIYHPQLAIDAHAAQVCGIAVQSGPPGSTLLVRAGGLFEDNSWAWTPGFVFCGDDGVLTQTAPATGWSLKIGTAHTPTTIAVDIDMPFYRS